MGKKGLSLEDKRQKILEIYYEKKEVFNLKEIEKFGAKKGVGKFKMNAYIFLVFQTIKDVNQSLVDDNLVETDKIGAGAFFWALPSKGYQSRQNLINNTLTKNEEVKQQISEIEEKIKQEKELRRSNDGEREQMLAEFQQLQKENQEFKQKLKLFEKCDPKRLEDIAANKQICKAGMIRWTDNLFEMENWIKKNNPAMTNEQIYENFPILQDLDYIE